MLAQTQTISEQNKHALHSVSYAASGGICGHRGWARGICTLLAGAAWLSLRYNVAANIASLRRHINILQASAAIRLPARGSLRHRFMAHRA